MLHSNMHGKYATGCDHFRHYTTAMSVTCIVREKMDYSTHLLVGPQTHTELSL